MVFIAYKGCKREKGTLVFRRVINIVFNIADLQSNNKLNDIGTNKYIV